MINNGRFITLISGDYTKIRICDGAKTEGFSPVLISVRCFLSWSRRKKKRNVFSLSGAAVCPSLALFFLLTLIFGSNKSSNFDFRFSPHSRSPSTTRLSSAAGLNGETLICELICIVLLGLVIGNNFCVYFLVFLAVIVVCLCPVGEVRLCLVGQTRVSSCVFL